MISVEKPRKDPLVWAERIFELETIHWEMRESCQKCRSPENPSQILLCEKCENGWHTTCLIPPLNDIPEGYLAHVIEQPIFQILNIYNGILFTCLINSWARHSAIYILKSHNLFQFFLNLKKASKCVLRIIKKKSKQKFCCKYLGFGIRKFGCSMT